MEPDEAIPGPTEGTTDNAWCDTSRDAGDDEKVRVATSGWMVRAG